MGILGWAALWVWVGLVVLAVVFKETIGLALFFAGL